MRPDRHLDTIETAIEAMQAGRHVVVVDDADRENEGDLILAAEHATAETVGFMVRHTSGIICVALQADRAEALRLPPMSQTNTDPHHTAFTVSVDLREGVTTGISARDRAATIKALVDPTTTPNDLSRPGHVFPLVARDRGVLERPGHTEAAVDLARLAGLRAGGVLSEIVRDDGAVARKPELIAFAAAHGLPIISIADLIAYRRREEPAVVRMSDARIPTRHGRFRAVAYESLDDGTHHIALVMGEEPLGGPTLTRVHSECLTGDVLGSLRCDCGAQLEQALAAIAAEGRGVLVYIRGHEGRGIGLGNKLRAYTLQDRGYDTVDANVELGLPVDARDYAVAATILRDLGVGAVRLLTNNPLKQHALNEHGVANVERVPLEPLCAYGG
jgi:3,4-dihydroxy 2-butanone 4-phosphate synthase/GTP cyclohydrolase II